MYIIHLLVFSYTKHTQADSFCSFSRLYAVLVTGCLDLQDLLMYTFWENVGLLALNLWINQASAGWLKDRLTWRSLKRHSPSFIFIPTLPWLSLSAVGVRTPTHTHAMTSVPTAARLHPNQSTAFHPAVCWDRCYLCMWRPSWPASDGLWWSCSSWDHLTFDSPFTLVYAVSFAVSSTFVGYEGRKNIAVLHPCAHI